MDVEGYESQVLEGAEELIKSEQPMYVFIELHGKLIDKTDDIVEIFETNQFTPEYISKDGGKTYDELNNFDEAKNIQSNVHLFAYRT